MQVSHHSSSGPNAGSNYGGRRIKKTGFKGTSQSKSDPIFKIHHAHDIKQQSPSPPKFFDRKFLLFNTEKSDARPRTYAPVTLSKNISVRSGAAPLSTVFFSQTPSTKFWRSGVPTRILNVVDPSQVEAESKFDGQWLSYSTSSRIQSRILVKYRIEYGNAD